MVRFCPVNSGTSTPMSFASTEMPEARIKDIARERRAITVDTALRLTKFFGNSAEFWLGLQTDYDMACARESMHGTIENIRRFEPSSEQA